MMKIREGHRVFTKLECGCYILDGHIPAIREIHLSMCSRYSRKLERDRVEQNGKFS